MSTRTALVSRSSALEIFDTVRDRPFPFLLESAASGGFSYLGADPFLVLLAKGNRIQTWRAGRESVHEGNPFDALEALLDEFREERGAPPFAGGAVGWFGYDLGGHLERLPTRARDDLRFPDLFLAFYDRVFVIDPARKNFRFVDRNRGRRAVEPDAYSERFGGFPRSPIPRTFTRDTYLAAIERAKKYLEAGDIYQVNLSQRFETAGSDPWGVYQRLRTISPSPYSAYLEAGERAILSSSPEQFLEIGGRRVRTRPIKGTRPRDADPAEDERLRQELLTSPKDDAELAMIVDLERNDLGRVCEYGTIRVEEAKVLESHPTVHHLSATVSGRLRSEIGPVDVLRATFPGGSVTGAPKIRAMEIIDELEPTRRGVYTGAIGTIGFDGTMNLSVAIRMLHFDRDRFSFQVGGAIVADSDPEAEYRETLVKATGMARALGIEWNTSP